MAYFLKIDAENDSMSKEIVLQASLGYQQNMLITVFVYGGASLCKSCNIRNDQNNISNRFKSSRDLALIGLPTPTPSPLSVISPTLLKIPILKTLLAQRV